MIKVTLVLALGLAAAALLRRRQAAFRHRVLAAALACAALMPLIEAVAPVWQLPLLTARAGALAPALALGDAAGGQGDLDHRCAAAPAFRAPAVLPMLRSVWAVGVGLAFLLLATGIGRLGWVAARARPVQDVRWAAEAAALAGRSALSGPPGILQTNHPTLLFTWGLRRPKVLVPRDAATWSDRRSGSCSVTNWLTSAVATGRCSCSPTACGACIGSTLSSGSPAGACDSRASTRVTMPCSASAWPRPTMPSSCSNWRAGSGRAAARSFPRRPWPARPPRKESPRHVERPHGSFADEPRVGTAGVARAAGADRADCRAVAPGVAPATRGGGPLVASAPFVPVPPPASPARQASAAPQVPEAVRPPAPAATAGAVPSTSSPAPATSAPPAAEPAGARESLPQAMIAATYGVTVVDQLGKTVPNASVRLSNTSSGQKAEESPTSAGSGWSPTSPPTSISSQYRSLASRRRA